MVQLSADEVLDADFDVQSFDRLVWVYRTPWDTLHRQAGDARSTARTLSRWLEQHRLFTRRRRSFGKRLIVVNVGAINAVALAELLGIKNVAAPAARPPRDSWLSVLEKLVEWASPEHADVEETLDALAQHHAELHEPETAALLKPDTALRFAQLLRESRDAPQKRAALEAELKTAAKTIEALKADKAQEVEASATELRKVREELAKEKDKAAVFAKTAETNQTRLNTDLKAANEAVAQAKAQLAKAQTVKSEELKQAMLERDELLLQLHNAQEELERVFLKQKDEAAMWEKQCGALQESARTAQKEAKEEAENAAEAAKRQDAAITEARAENEDLIVQLHQVQEELERYFLKNRNLASVMAHARSSNGMAAAVLAQLINRTSASPRNVSAALNSSEH